MTENTTYVLISLGLIIIAACVTYILKHIRTEQARKQKLEEIAAKAAENTQKRRDYLIESIHMISHAVINDEQMTATEGCIRLNMLIESLAPHLLSQEPYSIIALVHQQTQHIPIKEQWKQLDKTAKRKFTKEMDTLEKKHKEQIETAVKQLKNYDFTSN